MMSVLGSGVWVQDVVYLHRRRKEVTADTMKEESDGKHFPCVL